jgi:hypothetical protein
MQPVRVPYTEETFIKTISDGQYYRFVLFPALERECGRLLSPAQKSLIQTKIRQMNPFHFVGQTLDTITGKFVQMFKNTVKTPEPEFDSREFMIRQMKKEGMPEQSVAPSNKPVQQNSSIESTIVKFLSYDTPSFLDLFNKDSAKRERRVILYADSKYRGTNNLRFSWTIFKNSITSQGTVNSIDAVENIKSIKVYPFRIPYSAEILDPQLARVSLLIEELSSQAFIAAEGRKFQFMFDAVRDSQWINLDSYETNEGVFTLDQKVVSLGSLTLSFGNPIVPIVFPQDRFSSTTVLSNPLHIYTSVPHTLINGDLVSFSQLPTVTTSAESAFYASLAAPQTVVITSNTSFQISVDPTTLLRDYSLPGIVSTSGTTVSGLGTDFTLTTNGAYYLVLSSGNYYELQADHTTPPTATLMYQVANVYLPNWASAYDIPVSGRWYQSAAGTVATTNGSAVVNGNLTNFAAFAIGDTLAINISSSIFTAKISSITSATAMTLDTPVPATTATSRVYRLFNSSDMLSADIYVESRRVIVPIEFTME